MATKKNTPQTQIAPQKPKAPTPETITTQSTSDRRMPTNMMLRYTPAEIAKRTYDLMLANMQQRAQLGQFDPLIGQGGYIGSPENLTPIYGQQTTGGFIPNSVQLASVQNQTQIPQDIIAKAKTEYMASLPRDMNYSAQITPTKYGGDFGSSAGSGFDAWFEKNYPSYVASSKPVQTIQPVAQFITQSTNQAAGIPQTGKQAQQAMQNYQNLLAQGLANYQAQTYPGQGQFGSMARPAQTSPQRKPSTPGFPTPKPFG